LALAEGVEIWANCLGKFLGLTVVRIGSARGKADTRSEEFDECGSLGMTGVEESIDPPWDDDTVREFE
jgi:hypothetical protein